MFLQKLEIIGFKSFAKKTVLDFSSRSGKNEITVIVGPNGSGKSNVADALRWVMGEQSMRAIRGKKTQDVIFSGSRQKTKIGSAQVSIFLDNSAKKLPLDFKQVVVSRKAFQNGENEYLINGSKVRLIDVLDLLAKAGVGQRSYCIVNQGMADRILEASLTERRVIIEEAAGVKEFQLKKERSERKLKSTKNNLVRVGDLLSEIEPHLKLLERQSKKAEQSEKYQKELKQKQLELYAFLWKEASSSRLKIEKEKKELEEKAGQFQKKIDGISSELKKNFSDSGSVQEKLAKLETRQRRLNQEIGDLERRLVVEEGKIQLEEERMDKIETVEVLPVGLGTIRENLAKIESEQNELVRKISAIQKIEDVSVLRSFAQKVIKKIQWLHQALIQGKIEKKVSSEKIKSQKKEIEGAISKRRESILRIKQSRDKLQRELEETRKKSSEIFSQDQKERRASIELEDQLRRERFDLEKVREKLNAQNVELAKVEVRSEDLAKNIQTDLQLSPEELQAKKIATPAVNVAKLSEQINRLRFKLEEVGRIDQAIIDEYHETRDRYEFLKKESEDLKESMKKLKKVIVEMDAQIKERFEEAFGKINKDFEKFFQVIFGGGKAKLEKVKVRTFSRQSKSKNGQEGADQETDSDSEPDEENQEKEEFQTGIEIVAQPPGKKIAHLRVLSGGERALTSIALLFAIISHNPPPFVFLDEVEAALDEANTKRFGKIIRELSNRTQFILISHNRQTMREASILYGVTMGGDGISKLLSVRLDQVDLVCSE